MQQDEEGFLALGEGEVDAVLGAEKVMAFAKVRENNCSSSD